MRRNAVLPPSARHLRAPAVIGSIALSFSLVPADGAAADDRRSSDSSPMKVTAHPALRAADSQVEVVGQPASSSAVRTYTVARGDTVSAIAAAHGVRTADVLAGNGLAWSSVIHPGDVLRMGPKAEKAKAAPAPTAETAASTYTVRRGDTLWAIARRNNISVDRLKSANGIRSSHVRAGQVLKIPAAGR